MRIWSSLQGWVLFGIGGISLGMVRKYQAFLPALLAKILGIVSGAAFLLGALILRYARQKRAFLDKPEREGPLSITK